MPTHILILILAIGEFMIGTTESIVTGIIGMVADDTGVSVSLAGQLVSGFSLAFAFGSPLLIALTARMERKKLLLLTLLLFIAGNLLAFLSPGFSTLMVSRVFLGLIGGVYTVVALAQAANMAPPEKKGRAIAVILMGFSVSLVLGVPAGTLLGDVWGWRPIFAIIAAATILPFVAIWLFMPKQQAQKSVPLRTQLGILKNRRVLLALCISFFFVTGYSTAYTYITPLLQTATGMTTAWISTTLLLAGVASVAGSRIGGMSTDKWGVRPTLYISLLAHAVILFVLPLSAQWFIGAIICIMIWIGAVQSTVPAQQYYLITLSPHSSEVALSINTSIFQLGLAIGAGLGGLIVEHSTVLNLGWVSGILVLAGLSFAWMTFSQQKKEKAVPLQACSNE
ncbi:putative MFS-type transporter YbcL [Brevibacillus reuszeri]|uniref:MFS transporter n=1 Tax=Brevibacillus reuszeri TaxID=54915 RepID=UPI001B231541|nr:MFS transporter [Brevibacillus reuszeri]GIO09207.1 putative MFS-type transporter YbcL [Brevibacillus reuszeri]